jgi:hypothetical protein
VLAWDATASRLAGSSLDPTRISMLLTCGCFFMITSRTPSSEGHVTLQSKHIQLIDSQCGGPRNQPDTREWRQP